MRAGNIYNIGGIAGKVERTYTDYKNLYNTGDINIQSLKATIYIGGIMGYINTYDYNYNMTNCCNKGNLEVNSDGYIYAGGINGYISTVGFERKNCNNYGDIVITSYSSRIGGIEGYAKQGTLLNCNNMGKIQTCYSKDVSCSGGIIGWHESGSSIINGCNNFGDVISTPNYTLDSGGIVGYTYGSVYNSTNYGEIFDASQSQGGYPCIGGIAGRANNIIQNCHNKNDVTATNWKSLRVGGICGDGQGVTESDNIGDIIASCSTDSMFAGGIAGCSGRNYTKIL